MKVLSIPFLFFSVLALTGKDIRGADYGTGYQTGYFVEISKPHEVFTFTTSGEKKIGPGMIARVQFDPAGAIEVQFLMDGQVTLSCDSKAQSVKIYVAQEYWAMVVFVNRSLSPFADHAFAANFVSRRITDLQKIDDIRPLGSVAKVFRSKDNKLLWYCCRVQPDNWRHILFDFSYDKLVGSHTSKSPFGQFFGEITVDREEKPYVEISDARSKSIRTFALPWLKVVSPNGGEVLFTDSSCEIKWRQDGWQPNSCLKIEFTKNYADNNSVWEVIKEQVLMSDRQYVWFISTIPADSSFQDCRIRISEVTHPEYVNEMSDQDFALLPGEKFCYVEDLESLAVGTNPLKHIWNEDWKKIGVGTDNCEIDTLYVTAEKAFGGSKSLKLVATLNGGGSSAIVWDSLLINAPCAGALKMSARIIVEEATADSISVGVGANFIFPPTDRSGCDAISRLTKPTNNRWILQEADLVSWGAKNVDMVAKGYYDGVYGAKGQNFVMYMDKWGIFLNNTSKSEQRVVVYIDDIRIEGYVPKQADYAALATKRFEPVCEKFKTLISNWSEVVDSACKDINSVGVEPYRSVVLETCVACSTQLKRFLDFCDIPPSEVNNFCWAKPIQVEELRSKVEPLRYAIDNLTKIAAAVEVTPEKPFVTFVPRRTITNSKILPNTFLVPAPIADTLQVTACQGEYEPTTFAVFALQNIDSLTVTAHDLRSGLNTIPADSLEINAVKCWYQAGIEVGDTNHKLLTPELLLKDDNLVKVDLDSQKNYLRVRKSAGQEEHVPVSGNNSNDLEGAIVSDEDALQRIQLPANSVKQFWVTIHVPEHTQADDYEGKIVIETAGSAGTLLLKLRVLPFKLEKPALRYSIYYRGILSDNAAVGSLSSEGKTEQQYRTEMQNLNEHGVEYPTIYQPYDNGSMLAKALEIRNAAGLPHDGPLYTLGISTRNPTEEGYLDALKTETRKWIQIAKTKGYNDVYVYGIDEAYGELLASQRPAWCAVHSVGGKVFVACTKRAFETMGCLLDLAVFAGPPNKEEASKYHLVHSQISCYDNPQVGNEEPETYRRNYGLLLWKAGYDGAMDYAYQHSFGHIWNDFDDPTYRDHAFAYPTSNGVINTIQWEGFREGVDDVRYVTTLLGAIEKAKIRNPLLAEQAKNWLNHIDVSGDLDELRRQMVDWILKLTR